MADVEMTEIDEPCPVCAHPLIVVGKGYPRSNALLVLVVSGGAQIFLAVMLVIAGPVIALCAADKSQVLMVLLALGYCVMVVFVWYHVLRSQRLLWRVLRGHKLLPATQQGGRAEIDYFALRRHFTRHVGTDENLEGGVSIVSAPSVDTEGALTLEETSTPEQG